MQKLDLPTGPDLPDHPNMVGIRTEIMDILEVNDKEFRDGLMKRQGFQNVTFCVDKSSLGVSRIDEATPWDDCPYVKSNANTFVRVLAGFFDLVCQDQPWGAPLVGPSTLGAKILYKLASLKYCYNANFSGVHSTSTPKHLLDPITSRPMQHHDDHVLRGALGRASARVERDLRPRGVCARRHALSRPPLGPQHLHLRSQVRLIEKCHRCD